MTQEDKELLLKDLCARLPYRVKVRICDDFDSNIEILTEVDIEENRINGEIDTFYCIDNVKPYLRPLSSMTEDEKGELQSFYPGSFGDQWLNTEKGTIDIFECSSTITLYLNDSERIIDWLNSRHFDYRGLIPMGLALKASKGMYNN